MTNITDISKINHIIDTLKIEYELLEKQGKTLTNDFINTFFSLLGDNRNVDFSCVKPNLYKKQFHNDTPYLHFNIFSMIFGEDILIDFKITIDDNNQISILSKSLNQPNLHNYKIPLPHNHALIHHEYKHTLIDEQLYSASETIKVNSFFIKVLEHVKSNEEYIQKTLNKLTTLSEHIYKLAYKINTELPSQIKSIQYNANYLKVLSLYGNNNQSHVDILVESFLSKEDDLIFNTCEIDGYSRIALSRIKIVKSNHTKHIAMAYTDKVSNSGRQIKNINDLKKVFQQIVTLNPLKPLSCKEILNIITPYCNDIEDKSRPSGKILVNVEQLLLVDFNAILNRENDLIITN